MDNEATETVPDLVVDLASSADRRERMPQRVEEFLRHGVRQVWVIDPRARSVVIAPPQGPSATLEESDVLSGGDVLPGFEVKVSELFVEPDWWRGR
jgi:Uma2 family endonuclease